MQFLLRKIRRNLMEKNKVTTYLLYAMGEIVLVVIGILIAVSLNNWNNQRNLKASQSTYLKALKAEFEENQRKLGIAISVNQDSEVKGRELLEVMGLTSEDISTEEVRRLVVGAINAESQYRPRNGVIQEIISSGKLELFDDDSLRFLISGWEGELQSIRFQEKDEREVFRQKSINALKDYVNVRDMFFGFNENYFDLTESRLPSREYDLLQSLQFENHLVGLIATSSYLDYRYRRLQKTQQELIDRIAMIQKKD